MARCRARRYIYCIERNIEVDDTSSYGGRSRSSTSLTITRGLPFFHREAPSSENLAYRILSLYLRLACYRQCRSELPSTGDSQRGGGIVNGRLAMLCSHRMVYESLVRS